MERVFLVAAAALLGATAAETPTTTAPGATGHPAPGGAPMQNFVPNPGMPGSTSPQQPSYGAFPGQPGSPTYNPNAALPSLNNSGTAASPSTGTSASGINTPSTSSGGSTSIGASSGIGSTGGGTSSGG